VGEVSGECLVRQLPNRQNVCLSLILQPYNIYFQSGTLSWEVAAVSEQFSVVLFFDDGQHKYVRRFVSAQEACRAFQHYSRGAGAQLELTVRVIVTDSSDCIVREWKYGEGVTFPADFNRVASDQHRRSRRGLSRSAGDRATGQGVHPAGSRAGIRRREQ
jgi:hypothetical protein